MQVLPRLLALCLAALLAAASSPSCVVCPAYVSLAASAKLALLWNKTTVNAYKTGQQPNSWPSNLGLFSESMDTTFDRFGDESNRPRLVHAHGTMAQVVWAALPGAASQGYTGVYASGSSAALLRLSLAGQPGSYSPGFAIKFLINGQTSSNIIGMFSLDGQGTTDFNFFRNQLRTTVPLPSSITTSFFTQKGLALFETGSTPATNLMPDQPSLYDSSGALQSKPEYPYLLYLVPNPALTQAWNNYTGDFRDGLATMTPVGTLLYTVYAATGSCQCNGVVCSDVTTSGCGGVAIATITTASAFVSSPYVDGGIFFRHSRWFKKTRSTCVYGSSLGDTGVDSTVLPTTAGDIAMCYSTSACPASNLVGTTPGCLVEDTYLLGSSQASSSLPIIIGAVVGGIFAVLCFGYLGYRFVRDRQENRNDKQTGFKGLVEATPNLSSAGSFKMGGTMTSPGPAGTLQSQGSMGSLSSKAQQLAPFGSSSSSMDWPPAVSKSPYGMGMSPPPMGGGQMSPPPYFPPSMASPNAELEDRLFEFYQKMDPRKTRQDAATVVAHFMAPNGGGLKRLNEKLQAKYGTILPPANVDI